MGKWTAEQHQARAMFDPGWRWRRLRRLVGLFLVLLAFSLFVDAGGRYLADKATHGDYSRLVVAGVLPR